MGHLREVDEDNNILDDPFFDLQMSDGSSSSEGGSSTAMKVRKILLLVMAVSLTIVIIVGLYRLYRRQVNRAAAPRALPKSKSEKTLSDAKKKKASEAHKSERSLTGIGGFRVFNDEETGASTNHNNSSLTVGGITFV